jgi:exonuclease SbcC
VKPLTLCVEGFTSFRDRVQVDFAGLDLFAITGPTGAGKSSLIDAIVFALYGQVPRVGDDYKQLLSHGAERLSVLFEFAVGKETYRVVRAVRKAGPSQQRLERRSAGGWDPLADKVKDIRAEVERILGLDYDGFTRSVVLPQGQFDAFLKGEPKERRKILVALLGLQVYEAMQQLANQKAAAARAEADFIRKQLETDYAGASAEALEQRRASLREAEARAEQARAALAAVGEGAKLAQEARLARRDVDAARREESEEQEALAAAHRTLDGAGEARAAVEAELGVVRQQVEALGFDETRHSALAGAKPLADQLVAQRQRLARAAAAVAEKKSTAGEAESARAKAEAALPLAEGAEREAREAEAQARAGREAAHREHAAFALRRGLRPGEPCPVCAQAVRTVPPVGAPGLEDADARAREAEARARAAGERLQEARLRVEQARLRAEARSREVSEAEEQEREARTQEGAVLAALETAGFAPAEGGDAAGLVARIQAEISRLEAARRARDELEAKRRQVEQRRGQLEASVAAATARRDAARARIDALVLRREAASRSLASSRDALLALASREGWTGLESPPAGRDEADLLEGVRRSAEKASADGAAQAAALRHSAEALEKALARVAELGEKRGALEKDAALHKTLADHLRANELVAWIQEEALQRLAAEGSRHLATLSQGRYELRLGAGEGEKGAKAEQDFFVVDRWNADSVRSVRTLSGGETFLASLALALALAESLAQLSAEGRAAEALESLFLDEGFGTLDAETLDVVVSALDALHGGQRVVGIVTHVRDLAERLPARLEVRRQGGTATAVVV